MVIYDVNTLDNGLRIVTAHMPSWRSIALGVFARAGSRHDRAKQHGLAHFTEHMLFKGTRRRSAKRIVLQAESVGGSLNAYTTEEQTCYHVRSPAAHLKRMVHLLADMYTESIFPESAIHRERQIIEDEILMYRDEPSSHIDDMLSSVTWPRHALGRSILGSLETLANIDRGDFFSHQRRSYGARNSVLALAGPQPPSEMVDAVAEEFALLPHGRRRATSPFCQQPGSIADHLITEERSTEQVHLRVAYITEGRHHPQVYTCRLLSVLLGETMSSRLPQELRERRGYCYSVGCSREVYEDTGLFTIQASFEPRFLRMMLTQIFRQLDRLRAESPSHRELRAAYQYVAGSHDVGLEETTTQMFWLGDAAIHREKELDPNRYLSRLAQVTPEDIQATAATIFQRANLRLALLGPDLEQRRSDLLAICEDLT